MMLKLGGRIGLVDLEQIGGALIGCFDCRRPQVMSLLGAIPKVSVDLHMIRT